MQGRGRRASAVGAVPNLRQLLSASRQLAPAPVVSRADQRYGIHQAVAALHAGLADGSIVSIMTPALQAETQARARATLDVLKPTKRITVRLSPVDLQTLQQKAQELGLPYQTLLKSVIHQYLTGQLVPRSSAV